MFNFLRNLIKKTVVFLSFIFLLFSVGCKNKNNNNVQVLNNYKNNNIINNIDLLNKCIYQNNKCNNLDGKNIKQLYDLKQKILNYNPTKDNIAFLVANIENLKNIYKDIPLYQYFKNLLLNQIFYKKNIAINDIDALKICNVFKNKNFFDYDKCLYNFSLMYNKSDGICYFIKDKNLKLDCLIRKWNLDWYRKYSSIKACITDNKWKSYQIYNCFIYFYDWNYENILKDINKYKSILEKDYKDVLFLVITNYAKYLKDDKICLKLDKKIQSKCKEVVNEYLCFSLYMPNACNKIDKEKFKRYFNLNRKVFIKYNKKLDKKYCNLINNELQKQECKDFLDYLKIATAVTKDIWKNYEKYKNICKNIKNLSYKNDCFNLLNTLYQIYLSNK